MDKYKGESYLLNILDRCPNYKTYFNRIGKALKTVGKTRVAGKESSGKALFPDICMGSARTSWSTIAQEELGIGRETIAAALGHHTVDVTSTYLRTDWKKKVDEANRKVLDWVFYSKRKKRSLT
jgi:integrase